ncbi:MAG: hypothetical protein IRZ14_08320 [Chloroflexi bacterium]|nr:hypothetical protein [Chloroflexota bacterium]
MSQPLHELPPPEEQQPPRDRPVWLITAVLFSGAVVIIVLVAYMFVPLLQGR